MQLSSAGLSWQQRKTARCRCDDLTASRVLIPAEAFTSLLNNRKHSTEISLIPPSCKPGWADEQKRWSKLVWCFRLFKGRKHLLSSILGLFASVHPFLVRIHFSCCSTPFKIKSSQLTFTSAFSVNPLKVCWVKLESDILASSRRWRFHMKHKRKRATRNQVIFHWNRTKRLKKETWNRSSFFSNTFILPRLRKISIRIFSGLRTLFPVIARLCRSRGLKMKRWKSGCSISCFSSWI